MTEKYFTCTSLCYTVHIYNHVTSYIKDLNVNLGYILKIHLPLKDLNINLSYILNLHIQFEKKKTSGEKPECSKMKILSVKEIPK